MNGMSRAYYDNLNDYLLYLIVITLVLILGEIYP